MKYILAFLMCALGCSILQATDAKEQFVAAKCVKCHSVESQQVETTSKKDPSEVHDLSDVGNHFADADSMAAYIRKETEREGKKHKFKFKGDEAELKVMVDWLLTLK